MEAAECGAAALGVVLAHHGLHVPLAELRRECGISRDGSKASNIVKAARRFGMEAKGYKKTLQTIGEVELPAIIFWGFNHFVVLEGFKKGNAYLNDPANGRRVVSMDEFDKGFTGVVLAMHPGPKFQRGGERPSVASSLRRNLRGSYGALAFCVLAGFSSVIPTLALPVLAQVFIDDVLIEARTSWVVPLLAGMLAAVTVAGLLDLLQLRHLRDLRVKLAVSMSSRFLLHVLRLPISYFTQRYSGEIANRIELNDRVAQLLSGRLATTTIDATMLLFYAGLMLWYDWVLTLVGVAAALANVLGLRLVARARIDANMQVLQEGGKLDGVAIAGLQSMETLKASALEGAFFSRWSGHYAKAMNASQALTLTNKLLGLLPRLLASVTSLLVLILGGLRVMDGVMSIGMLIAFQAILFEFNKPVSTLVGMLGRLQTLRGDLLRLDDVLEQPIDPALEV
jgi:ATP-binding cassette subfamily C protein